MSTLQFPASPNDGDSFTASNGVTYTFDATGGTGWTANNPVGIDDEYVNIDGDTMTGDLVLPNLEASGDIQSTSQNGGPLAGFRNQLINGDFRVWQRGTSVTVQASGIGYGPDRWRAVTSGTVMSRGTGLGADYPGAFGVRVNYPTSSGCSIAQAIELPAPNHFGPFTPGSKWTVSAYFENPDTASFNVLFATGTQGPGDLWSPGEIKTYETIRDKTRISQVFTAPLTMASGRTSCLVVLENSVNNSVFTQAQFEPGSVATPFENRPIGTELALCQRYYQTMGDIYLSPIKSDNIIGTSFPRTVDMRTTPTESADFSKVIGGVINGTLQKWNVTATSYFDTNTANVLKPIADAEL